MTLTIRHSRHFTKYRHGFFKRNGGVSSGLYESLNCNLNSSDNLTCISKNRRLVTKKLEIASANLITLKQIHSSKVIVVEAPFEANLIEADAMVTAKSSIGLGILTADCAPILMADDAQEIIGVVHAGWRGSLNTVIENTIREMRKLGARIENINAAIGPCIHQKNYEVGEEFFELFKKNDHQNVSFFRKSSEVKFLFDLPGFIHAKLQSLGVGSVHRLDTCTFENEKDYFSHRRNKKNNLGDCGRMISAITM